MNASSVPASTTDDRFNEVLALIQSAKKQAIQAVNTQLIELYWQVGAYISRKLEKAEWGQPVGRASGSDSTGIARVYPVELVSHAPVL
jgi:hypothetical protein